MRGLRGWIRNLSDGLGPPAGTVDVHATYQGDNAELDNTTHQTGVLQRVHVLGGSGSNTKADPFGHFGWNMELSPGQIKQAITPTDPQTEYRFRYPDESAQIGKAYHTDLERLAWTAGRDGIVWNAINAGNDPASAAGWSNDPTSTLSWGVGNGSIASFGPTAGKITIRPFIAFVGGAVFSVEMADLEVPPAGGSALPANGGGSDRWDLLYLKIITDPTLSSYGKQTFELLQGTPGAGIPTHPGQTAGARILPMFGLKKAAAATPYSSAYDLRRWINHPSWRAITKQWGGVQDANTLPVNIETASVLNTVIASSPIVLPPGTAWDGYVTLSGSWAPTTNFSAGRLSVVIISEALDLAGNVVAGSGAMLSGAQNPAMSFNGTGGSDFSLTVPLSTISSYHLDSGVIADSRNWHTLRFRITYLPTLLNATVSAQQLRAHLWPAR